MADLGQLLADFRQLITGVVTPVGGADPAPGGSATSCPPKGPAASQIRDRGVQYSSALQGKNPSRPRAPWRKDSVSKKDLQVILRRGKRCLQTVLQWLVVLEI